MWIKRRMMLLGVKRRRRKGRPKQRLVEMGLGLLERLR